MLPPCAVDVPPANLKLPAVPAATTAAGLEEETAIPEAPSVTGSVTCTVVVQGFPARPGQVGWRGQTNP